MLGLSESTSPSSPGKHIIFSRFKLSLILCTKSNIICLTRQPIRKVKSSRSGENKQLSKAAYPVKDKAALLIFHVQDCNNQKTSGQDYHKFFICTHKHSPFRKTRNGCIAALSAAGLSILYCHGAAVSRFEIEKQVAFKMRMLRNVSYAYPEVNKVDITHLK